MTGEAKQFEREGTSAERFAKFSPKEFLKARRPERFSDSLITEKPILDRSMLEYHLDTLTNRNQDVAFATFAQRLAEREICPNLLPQTGPTGGGDSKVDSETYPVADSLALGWYTGIGREAASERWGFAFSAKKQWQGKFSSDVTKAVETNRGYTKIFFITNQFVRDKERARAEDKLRDKFGIDVRVLDRTWILDKVFTNEHEALAIEDLQISVPTRQELRKGPLDSRRAANSEDVESRIRGALRAEHFTSQLVDDCIEAADLARQMERPRVEIDGLYERAEQIALRCGTDYQRFQVAYQRAWTTYWWHEDYARFNQLYDLVEKAAKTSSNACELELLSNCWSLLHNAVISGKLEESSSKHAARTDTLSGALARLSRDDERPSAALHAKSLLLNMRLLLNIRNEQGMDAVLRDFKEVIQSCEGLVGFPFEPLVQIITELGSRIGNLPAYDDLFAALVAVETNRKKDLTAALMLLQRGEQQIKANQPYAAIRSLGLSLERLYKNESRRDAVYALYLCAHAYEQVGLLWAARGTLLSATSLAIQELTEHGEITKAQAACYRRLKWVELRLGRIAQALAWHEVDTSIRGILAGRGLVELDFEAEVAFDGSLGIILLKTDFWGLNRLSLLPDVLDSLGLFNASVALKYALGNEEELRGGFFQKEESNDEIYEFFLKWRDQPDGENLAEAPVLYEEQHVTLESSILGCKISVNSENASPCVELSESVLAALESLLSTGTLEWMMAHQPILTIGVRRAQFLSEVFEFELQEKNGRPHIEITCSDFDAHSMSRPLQAKFKESLLKLLATIIGRIAVAANLEEVLTGLFRDELALGRSINFTASFVTLGNALGSHPKIRISQWSVAHGREYSSRRVKAWDADSSASKKQKFPETKPLTLGEGEPPLELTDRSQVNQREIRTISVIRETLWEKAKWAATAFATTEEEKSPPILAIAFKDIEAGKQIFRLWREEIGVDDREAKLRIAIVRGINRLEPYSYRVIIGSNAGAALSSPSVRYAAFVSRIHTMHPSTDIHLERFLRFYRKFNQYFFVPALFKGTANPDVVYDQYLIKRELCIREAWKIGRHDPDSVAIHDEDKPVIPADVTDAPVLELLRYLETKRTRALGRIGTPARSDGVP